MMSVLAAAVLCHLPTISKGSEERSWEERPYEIRAVLAIDAPGGLAQHLAAELPKYLKRRVNASIGPIWSFDIAIATGVLREHVLSKIITITEADDISSDEDKLLFLTVHARADCFELTAREFDRYTQRWSTPIQTKCRQLQGLPEQLFTLAHRAVAPLARLELDSDDESRVRLSMRGASLARHQPDSFGAARGEIFLPILRRTARNGEVFDGGIQAVPWTYIEIVENDGEQVVGHVHSGARRPFGARRQGRAEQIAIAARAEPADTILRLHSRTNADKPLVGYEVFTQQAGETTPTRIGATDRQGKLSIPPGKSALRMLYLKNGRQLLARLPIVPGIERQIDVPLPDDDPRLAAEARLEAIREDLIDVVARRNILMARARQKIKTGDLEAAQKMLTAIDELPGRAQFSLTLTAAARVLQSDDPQIQRRIDQLVAGTQTVLNQFLDVQPISELHNKLRAAQVGPRLD